jgi:two-component system, cell cycle response regulator DivK
VKTVLLVDYDPQRIDAVRRVLASAGVRVLLATDAEAGRRVFNRILPDLTLIQDLIPITRGYRLCSELKRSAHGAGSPIVLFAFVRNGGRRRVLASGCDAWIENPFEEAVLVEAVARLLPDLSLAAAEPA